MRDFFTVVMLVLLFIFTFFFVRACVEFERENTLTVVSKVTTYIPIRVDATSTYKSGKKSYRRIVYTVLTTNETRSSSLRCSNENHYVEGEKYRIASTVYSMVNGRNEKHTKTHDEFCAFPAPKFTSITNVVIQ